MENGTISKPKGSGSRSLLTHEPLRKSIEDWLSSDMKCAVTPRSFMEKVNGLLAPYEINMDTARRWLLKDFGWVMSRNRKGIYHDGHEREDVVRYRKEFLERMLDIERRMTKEKGILPPDLSEGERPLIFYTHDESTFEGIDQPKYVYHPPNRPPLYKKSSRLPIMVSEFMSEVDGPIKEVHKVLKYGTDRDDEYWTGAGFANQFKSLVDYHKRTNPEYDAVVALDNAAIHSSFAADAPRACMMTLRNNGSSPYRANGLWWYDRNGERVEQSYTFEDRDGNDIPKGMRTILQERGIETKGLLKKCKICPVLADNTMEPSCCVFQILDHQPDFMAAKTMVEQAIEGHSEFEIIYYPKFHPELNFIEMYWGNAKRNINSCRMKEWEGTVVKALDSVTIDTIRAYAGRAFRYMQRYREGLTGVEAEHAMKIYIIL
jgi:hypothetical protein